jgi:hypothetical protein
MAERLVGNIVDRCLNTWLLGTYSAQYNSLLVAVTATATEFSCQTELGEIGTHSLIAVDDELCYVVERDTTNNRLVVVRGVRGTVATTHALGAALEINPRFPRFMVRTAMQEEIDSWTDALYQPKTFSASLGINGGVIAVPAEIDGVTVAGVIRVRRLSLATLDGRYRRTNGYEVEGEFDGAGGTINLTEDVGIATTFQVTCACAFDTDQVLDFGDDCDLIGDVGLSVGMCEIAELGAAYRLLVGRASVRLFPEAEGQSRSSVEVGARDIPAFAESIMKLRSLAEVGEVERLVHKYGFGGQ